MPIIPPPGGVSQEQAESILASADYRQAHQNIESGLGEYGWIPWVGQLVQAGQNNAVLIHERVLLLPTVLAVDETVHTIRIAGAQQFTGNANAQVKFYPYTFGQHDFTNGRGGTSCTVSQPVSGDDGYMVWSLDTPWQSDLEFAWLALGFTGEADTVELRPRYFGANYYASLYVTAGIERPQLANLSGIWTEGEIPDDISEANISSQDAWYIYNAQRDRS